MTIEDKIDVEKCFWKGIADKDAKTRATRVKMYKTDIFPPDDTPEANVTLDEAKPCYKCDGYNVNCFDYVKIGDLYA